MADIQPRITRRRLLGSSAALAGSLAMSPGVRISRAAAQGKQFSGKLVIATIQNPVDKAKQALADAYKAQQSGVEIAWETQQRQPDEYTSYLGTQLAAGDIALDIVSGNYFDSFRGYVNLDQYRRTTNPYTGHPWDQDLDWDFYRGINAAGERTMLATRSVHINWFYNKDLFAKAGVEPPKTWTEFVDVSAKLKDAGITPIVGNYDYQIPQWFAEVYFDQYHTDWVNTVRAQSGDWNYDPTIDDAFQYDPTNPNLHNTYTYNQQRFYGGIRDGKLRFDTPAVAEIVKNMSAIFPKYATGDFFVIGDPYPTFLQQQAAIMPSGTWALSNLKQDLEALSPDRLKELGIEEGSVKTFEWGTFENPAMEGDLVQSPVRSVESATGEYVSIVDKNQDQTDLAVDFLMFWLSPAGYQPYLTAYADSGELSPSGPLEIIGVQDPPEFRDLFSQVTMLGNAEINYNGAWTSSSGTTVHQDLRGLFKKGLEGDLSPEDYGAALQKYFTDNLDAILDLAGLTQADLDDPARQPGT
jgi:ABC-type glycerol-3-phosphate transport system substrate-binding protein